MLDNLHWLDVPERVKYSHHFDSSLPHRYRATVSSCRLCSGLWDGTETSSTLRRWSSARRTVWTYVAFGRSLYSVWDYGTLCLDCCVTLATTLLALDILWSLKTFFLSEYCIERIRGFGDYALYKSSNLRITYLLTYLLALTCWTRNMLYYWHPMSFSSSYSNCMMFDICDGWPEPISR